MNISIIALIWCFSFLHSIHITIKTHHFEPYTHNGLQKDFVSKNGKSGYLMIYCDDDPTRIGDVHRVNAESKVLDFPAVQNAIQEKRSIFGVPVEITLEGESFHAVNAVVPLFSGNQLIGVLSMSINLDTIVQQIVLNKENSVYENDFISILSTGGVYAASDDISLFGKKIAEVNTHPPHSNKSQTLKPCIQAVYMNTSIATAKKQSVEFLPLKYSVTLTRFGVCLSLRRKLQSMYHYEKSQ